MRFSLTGRGVLSFLALIGAAGLACVGGHIPPTMFQFTNVVPYTPPGEGGWKVAQVVVMMGRISTVFPMNAVCEIEVGVPEKNRLGWVTDELAQAAAAKAADEAARIVLRERLPTAMACAQFRKHMEGILRDSNFGPIPGARVSAFKESGVPKKTFP